jgi:HEAT repeat protein
MEVLSPLLVALEDPKQSKRAMEGLQQILSIKSDAVLPLLFPKLIVSPLTPFNAQALASIAKVVGPSIVKYLGIVLPVFLNSSYDETIRKCAEHFVIVIDAADELVSSLLPFLQTTPDIKTRASQLVAHYCTHTEADLTAQWHVIIQSLLKLFCDPVPAVREVAASSLKEIAERIPKEDLTNFISTVRDAMNMLKPNLIEGGIPGFDLPKALDPISAIFVAGLRAANPELRERAALGVAEMVELTTEKALAPYIIAVTGPIIRAMGDRVPVSVKVALLNTMMIIMEKSGARLKPFVPQLQTTFLKALQDPSVDIRYHASTALQKLLKQGPRIDPLITELVSSSQSAEVSIQEGLLRALKDTVVATGDKIGAAVISSAVAAMHSLLSSEDDRVRDRAAQVLSVLSPYVPLETILSGLLEEGSTVFEHGSVLVLRHLAPRVSLDPYLDAISAKLDRNLATEVPLLKVATLETVAALLSQKDSALQTLVAGRFLDSIGAEVNTGSIEIALACLRCLKTFGKTSPSQCEAKLASSWVSPIVNRVKDHSNAVLKVAAERALYYVFNCRSGSAVVQRYAAALPNKEDAKYLADLYKRVLSKFSPDSDNEEEE